MQDGDVTAQICGITYSQIWAKKGVTQNLRNFLIYIARHCESAAESDQPRSFLARQPLWQTSFFQLTLER